MNKKKVKFIAGRINKTFKIPFGGTPMTVHCFLESFKNDPDYEIIPVARSEFEGNSIQKIQRFRQDADIFHVDDTHILEIMSDAKLNPPDVIGPISRSPIKDYKGREVNYHGNLDWFYAAEVIRLNYSEERHDHDRVILIDHGVDTEYLQPRHGLIRKYILWAGAKSRPAKNYEMFEEIKKITKLPSNYEFMVMNKYNVADYWKILDRTALVINTSKYESFCCAMFEAKAKGVPVIYRKGLHGVGVHEKCRYQVEYEPIHYKKAIEMLLAHPDKLRSEGVQGRAYTESNASLQLMNSSIREVYDWVIEKRNPTKRNAKKCHE